MSKANPSCPWYSTTLEKLREKRDYHYTKWKETNNFEHELEFKSLKSKYQRKVRKAKSNHVDKILSSDTIDDNEDSSFRPRKPSKSFWSYIKSCKTDSCGVAPLHNNGVLAASAKDKATILNNQYCSVFTKDTHVPIPDKGPSPFRSIDDISISVNGVEKLLNNLDPKTASGPDGITARFLKEEAKEVAPILSVIFQKSLDTGEVPSQWKHANVTPIFKKGDRHKPANYRPVSLTSIVCKLLEHIISKSIMNHLEENNILNDSQHGFRPKRSCEAQLIGYIQDLASNLSVGKQIDTAVMDFSKAFDKVSHARLIYKLGWYGIRGSALAWIKEFLAGRTQKVVLDGEESPSSPVISGVPQGSVLGPILFLVFINDLPDSIKSTVRLFADDTIAYRVVASNEDCARLQKDLDEMVEWERRWGMEFNPDKCEILRVTRRKSPISFPYSLKGHTLNVAPSTKYLGVEIQSGLQWNNHINTIANKANRTLGFIKRNIQTSSLASRELAYKALVRPSMAYCSSIWDPYTADLKGKLERVQRRAARYVCNRYHNTSSVSNMLQDLGWESLEERRAKSRLILMFKITHHLVTIPTYYLVPAYSTTRASHIYKYQQIFTRTQFYQYSFFPRTIREWNKLPASVVEAPNLLAFKQALNGVPAAMYLP